MKINGKTYTLAKTTLADIKAIAPMKYVEGWAPDDDSDCIECETDAAIDVEGMRFKVIFWFDVEEPEDPCDAARLAGMRLYPEHRDEDFFASVIKWKNKIFKRYACILEDQEDFMPFYSVEIAYPDEREDTWRLKMQLNAASQENEITIEVE